MAENYYLSRKKNLLRSFDRAIKWLITPLVNRHGKEFSSAVAEQARQEYEELIPQIPFIGGAKNRWTDNLIEAAQILALYRAMQAQGKPLNETTDILREAMQIRLAQYPRLALRLMGRLQFSRLFLNGLQRQARETHKRAYPENFVADIVRGDGKDFDWGIDFTECAILKFYKAQNAAELLPYVCQLDYLTSAAFGLGLVRTKTLADGNEKCNSRLKQGRETAISS